MEPSTAAKGAVGGLALGGGGTGIYYAGEAYSRHRLENLNIKDYARETEKYVDNIDFIDSLNDSDAYLKTLGTAYSTYKTIYPKGVDSISDVDNDTTTVASGNSGGTNQAGIGIKNWCKKSMTANKKEDRRRVQHWCIKRLTTSEKFEKDGLTDQKNSNGFKDEDFDGLEDGLTKLGYSEEISWLNGNSGTNREKVYWWCSTKMNSLYYEKESGSYHLMKEKCFK